MRRVWVLVAVVAVIAVQEANATLQDIPTTSPLDSSSLKTDTEHGNEPCFSPEEKCESFDSEKAVALEHSDGSINDTKILSRDEDKPRGNEDRGTANDEEKRNAHDKNDSTSSSEFTSSASTTTASPVASTLSSTGLTASEPSSRSAVTPAFPPSRHPELNESTKPRQISDIIAFLLARWGPEQKFKSVVQILFFHLYILSFFYLFVVIHQGILSVIDLLRTPLLIYKEVDGYEEMMATPAPTMPPIHKDYGYTGGFKTPEGEKIEYMSYPAPKTEQSEPEDLPEPEMPPKPAQVEQTLATMTSNEHATSTGTYNEAPYQEYYNPGVGSPHEPFFGVFHEHPRLPIGNPLLVQGGRDEVSSYVSYAGE